LNAPALTHRAVLADLDTDTDRCPDVITSEGGAAGLRHWDGVMGTGHCTLKPAGAANGDVLPAVAGSAPTSLVVGRVALDPPVLGVAADALVTTDGVFAFIPSTPSFAR